MSAPTSSPSLRAFSSSILFMRSPAIEHKRRRPFRTGAVAYGFRPPGPGRSSCVSDHAGNCRTNRGGQGQMAGTTYFTVSSWGEGETAAANSSSIAERAAEQTGGPRRGESDLAGNPLVAVGHEHVGAEAGEDHLPDAARLGRRGPDRLHRDPRRRAQGVAENPG